VIKRIFAIALFATSAFAEGLRSDQHFLKIDAQRLGGNSRQYVVRIFDASRSRLTDLEVMTKGDAAEESETVVSGRRYKVRVEPHGEAYLLQFTAEENRDVIDMMRGGFTLAAQPRQTPRAALRAGRDVKGPKVLRKVEALYTDEARAAGAAGAVILEVTIDRSGFVREATVVRGMGYGLEQSAADAVQQWVFEPSMQGNTPVEVVQEVTVEFKP
jgi:TonB family protein